MKRAAILIGVDQAGDLPKLRDAAAGAELMNEWAQAQGMKTSLITDAHGPVSIQSIKTAIKSLVDAANVHQLLVYFAGHGVNLQRQEYWLLTDAPDDPQAAVNVATSASLASTCGIAHVVMISDACRTAPEGIRAQSIRGSEIFPNREQDTTPVDQFFACQLGKPSHEFRDPSVTSAEFQALYTRELVPALRGQREKVITWNGAVQAGAGHVHMRPLRDFLHSAVTGKLTELKMQTSVIQVPVAQISSDPPAWVSEIAPRPLSPSEIDNLLPAGGRGFDVQNYVLPRKRVGLARPQPPAPGLVPGPESVMAALLSQSLDDARLVVPPQAQALLVDALRLAEPFGPTHHETGCGFKLRGARAIDAFAYKARVEIVTSGVEPGVDLRVFSPAHPCSNVLIVLESGAGVLLPAIPEFLCALTFDDEELVDVSYEPSDNTSRSRDYQQRAQEIRRLRAIASSATAGGTFKLEAQQAEAIARRMQINKSVDPSLALYAAYAYHDLQRRDLLNEMADFMRCDLGAAFFDLSLLARALDRQLVTANEPPLLGVVPLLAKGWALLPAFQVRLAATLAPLHDARLPSLWTLFDRSGVDVLRRALSTGEIQ